MRRPRSQICNFVSFFESHSRISAKCDVGGVFLGGGGAGAQASVAWELTCPGNWQQRPESGCGRYGSVEMAPDLTVSDFDIGWRFRSIVYVSRALLPEPPHVRHHNPLHAFKQVQKDCGGRRMVCHGFTEARSRPGLFPADLSDVFLQITIHCFSSSITSDSVTVAPCLMSFGSGL